MVKIIAYIIVIISIILYLIFYFHSSKRIAVSPDVKDIILKPVPLLQNSRWNSYIKIPKDGSCFYHSILYSISKTYRLSQHDKKANMVMKFRNSIAHFCTYERWKSLYSSFISYENIQHNLLNEWAGNVEWQITADYLDIKIVIFRETDNSLYWGFDENNINHSQRYIFILNKNDNHFEPIIYRKGQDFQYIFHLIPSTLHLLKKIKYK